MFLILSYCLILFLLCCAHPMATPCGNNLPYVMSETKWGKFKTWRKLSHSFRLIKQILTFMIEIIQIFCIIFHNSYYCKMQKLVEILFAFVEVLHLQVICFPKNWYLIGSANVYCACLPWNFFYAMRVHFISLESTLYKLYYHWKA